MVMREPSRANRLEDIVSAGRTALESGRFEEAVNHFKSALRAGTRSIEQEAAIRCDLSAALGKRGLSREQLDAVAKYNTFSNFTNLSEATRMRVLVRLGWAYSFNSDIPRAIALFDQAMRMARQLNDDAAIGGCYFGLGRAYRNLSELQISRDHYMAAQEHFRKVGHWRELAESYINIGYINAFEGSYQNALHCLNQALTILGDRSEYDLLGRAHMYIAITYDNLGYTSKALESWEICIDNCRRAGNTLYLSINENNLAMKLIWLGQFARSEELARSALSRLQGTTGVWALGGAMDTLAQLYILYGKIDEADELLRESLEVLSSIKAAEWASVSTRTTIARNFLMKGDPNRAIEELKQAIDICLRSGSHYMLPDSRLWLAEAMLASGQLESARETVECVRQELRSSPNLIAWGFMMRVMAKIEAADGHVAAAIQSLRQSSSIYELRENSYAVAVNRVELAKMYRAQGKSVEAGVEVRAALEVFASLGAVVDERKARQYLELIEAGLSESDRHALGRPAEGGHSAQVVAKPDLASAVDGFVARRLVQASVSRELLLHELASVVQDEAMSRGVVVAEVDADGLKAEAWIGLTEIERARELELVSRLSPGDYEDNFVYGFGDNQQSRFLLHIVDPTAPRFRSGTVNLQPLLFLAEQGLEAQVLRSKTRRMQVFDPAQMVSDAELPGFICGSRAMNRVLEQIHKIRSSDVTVLITGESGTGKELIARAVHAGSSRRTNVFLPFNCSAAPRDMIESQLFGYRKGAFTGAVSNYEGIIRAAERGTLFLDEIGDLPHELQPKLLRFLQEGEIHPLGESHPLHVDVRVIAATNSDLERAVAEGRFREDLFHRLNVIRVHIPPLRERREEIPALINYYLNLYQQEIAKSEIKLAEDMVDLMVVYDWPGNVRQLCNEIRRIVTYGDSGSIVGAESLSPEIARISRDLDAVARRRSKRGGRFLVSATPKTTLAEAVNELEKQMIKEALERSSGNIAQAAKDLGLSRKGLYLKMDRLNFNN
jgi:DNA-binding NtrC family response regulator/tetratricopeptide (TPR) repeat protein